MNGIPIWARVGAKVVCIKRGRWVTVPTGEAMIGPGYGEIGTITHIETDTDGVWLKLPKYPDFCCVHCFRPLVTEADDVALFQRLVADMPISERLDRLAEKLNEEAAR